MLNPVTDSRTKPNSQAMRIAAKNDGSDIPIVVINNVKRFKKLLFTMAVSTPRSTPITNAKSIDTNASIKVLGKASESIVPTGLLLWYEYRRYGVLNMILVLPIVAILAYGSYFDNSLFSL